MKRSYLYLMVIALLMPLSSMPMKRGAEEREETAEKRPRVENTAEPMMIEEQFIFPEGLTEGLEDVFREQGIMIEQPVPQELMSFEKFEELPPELRAYILPLVALPLRNMTEQEIDERFISDMQQLSKTLQSARLTNKKMRALIDDRRVLLGIIGRLMKHYHTGFMDIVLRLKIPAARKIREETEDMILKGFESVYAVDRKTIHSVNFELWPSRISSQNNSLMAGFITLKKMQRSLEKPRTYYFIAQFNSQGLDQSFGTQGIIIIEDIVKKNADHWTDYFMPGKLETDYSPEIYYGPQDIILVPIEIRTAEYKANKSEDGDYILLFTPNGTLNDRMGHRGLLSFRERDAKGDYKDMLLELWKKSPDYDEDDILGLPTIHGISFAEMPDGTGIMLKIYLDAHARVVEYEEYEGLVNQTAFMIVPINLQNGSIMIDQFNPAESTLRTTNVF